MDRQLAVRAPRVAELAENRGATCTPAHVGGVGRFGPTLREMVSSVDAVSATRDAFPIQQMILHPVEGDPLRAPAQAMLQAALIVSAELSQNDIMAPCTIAVMVDCKRQVVLMQQLLVKLLPLMFRQASWVGYPTTEADVVRMLTADRTLHVITTAGSGGFTADVVVALFGEGLEAAHVHVMATRHRKRLHVVARSTIAARQGAEAEPGAGYRAEAVTASEGHRIAKDVDP
jgi:hypothetical protein